MPYSSLKMRSLIKDIQDTRPELHMKVGIFTNTIKDYSIKIGRKDNETQMLYDMMIYDHSQGRGNEIINIADSGKMYISPNKQYMVLDLYHGSRYEEIEETTTNFKNRKLPFERHFFDKETILFALDGFGLKRNDESLWKDHYQMMNINQLQSTIDSLSTKLEKRADDIPVSLLLNNYFRREVKADSLTYQTHQIIYLDTDSLFGKLSKKSQLNAIDLAINFARSAKNYVENTHFDLNTRGEWLSRYRIEWHRKYTLSFACFILFFIGAPLGAIIRKGGLGMPVVVSMIFFLLYYVISITGEKIAREGDITPFEGMWLSSFILFPIGLFLTYKASTDSVILNVDSYLEKIKQLIAMVKKIIRKA